MSEKETKLTDTERLGDIANEMASAAYTIEQSMVQLRDADLSSVAARIERAVESLARAASRLEDASQIALDAARRMQR